MPAKETPLPLSVRSVRAHFAGFAEALEEVASAAYPDASDPDTAVETLVSSAIRSAQYRLEERSEIPFFVTRYCTRELASQESLTLGTHFDRYIQPQAYRRDNWLKQTGRTRFPHAFLDSIQNFKLSLSNNAEIAALNLTWLQRDDEKGVVHVIPSGLATAGLNFQTLYGVSLFVRGAAVGRVPCLIHLRYSAGLVQRTGSYADPESEDAYDPEAFPVNTNWSQELVEAYREALGHLATGILYKPVGAYLSAGGVRIALDGLSESIDGGELQTRGKDLEQEALRWAEGMRDRVRGPAVAFI